MIFHNSSPRDLRFELGNKLYVVPRGAEVDIPDRIAYCIAGREIPLTKGEIGGRRVAGVTPLRSRNTRHLIGQPSAQEVADLLADVTGEDPPFEDEGEEQSPGVSPTAEELDAEQEGLDAAQKTLDQLDAAGIRIPGARLSKNKRR